MAVVVTRVGAKIRHLRKSKGLDLPTLSRLTEISKAELAKIEVGDRLPDLIQLIRLSCSLEVLIKDLSPGCELAEHSEAIRSVHLMLRSMKR